MCAILCAYPMLRPNEPLCHGHASQVVLVWNAADSASPVADKGRDMAEALWHCAGDRRVY